MLLDVLFFGLCFAMFTYGLAMAEGRKLMPKRKHRLYVYDKHPHMALVWAYDIQDAVAKFSRVYTDVEREDVYPAWYNPFKVAVLK